MPDLSIRDISLGRNGIDSPLAVPEGQCCDALNMDLSESPLGSKRAGSVAVSTTGGTAFATSIRSLFRHVPGDDETAAELWAVDANGLVKRFSGGAWADVTLADAISAGTAQFVEFASLNGKLFMAYKSSVNRLHVYDPTLSAPKVRRVGIAASAAPTVANTGGGAYPATLRYYRVRFIQYDGTTVTRRSEPSPSQSFTPSGAGTAARITKPTNPGEDETHWEVEGSVDNDVFFVLAGVAMGNAIVIGTTTYDDSATPANYSDNELSEEIGLFTLPVSARYLSTDNNRLLMAGCFEDSKLSSHVYFTPVLGATDHGDDERVESTAISKGYVALNRRDGGIITGLAQ